jgi:hypothetical protein
MLHSTKLPCLQVRGNVRFPLISASVMQNSQILHQPTNVGKPRDLSMQKSDAFDAGIHCRLFHDEVSKAAVPLPTNSSRCAPRDVIHAPATVTCRIAA